MEMIIIHLFLFLLITPIHLTRLAMLFLQKENEKLRSMNHWLQITKHVHNKTIVDAICPHTLLSIKTRTIVSFQLYMLIEFFKRIRPFVYCCDLVYAICLTFYQTIRRLINFLTFSLTLSRSLSILHSFIDE